MINDESHVQTQPLRVHRIPGHPRDEIVVESLLRKPALKKAAPDRLVADRYRLKERLRRRRAGVVFEAVDELGWISGEERRVAIQILDGRLGPGPAFAERFAQGVATLQTIEHPGIVRLLDAGQDGNRYFVALELPEAATLRYVLDDVRQLPATETAAVVRAIGDALQYLHARSIVHGNLKPENVLVTFDYEVKLLDVVPPEWPTSPPAEHEVRDDVFGLGCLAYEMLTGKHPFNSNTPREAERAGLRPEPILRLTDMQWRALAGALELQRAERTPTIEQFLREFGVIDTAGLRSLVSDGARIAPERGFTPEPAFAPAFAREPDPPAWIGGNVLLPERGGPYGARRSGVGGRLFALLLLGVIGALAYTYQDRLREEATRLMATVEAWVPDEPPAEALPPAEEVVEEPVVSANPAPDETAPVESEPAAAAPAPAAKAAAEPAAVPPASAAAAGPPRFSFAAPVITIHESEVAARIVIRRSGDTSGRASIAWWTTAGTADAERDFADLGRRVERFEPGERQRTVFVPLTNDTEAESGETFNVFLGRAGAARGTSEPQAGMQVQIADDD